MPDPKFDLLVSMGGSSPPSLRPTSATHQLLLHIIASGLTSLIQPIHALSRVAKDSEFARFTKSTRTDSMTWTKIWIFSFWACLTKNGNYNDQEREQWTIIPSTHLTISVAYFNSFCTHFLRDFEIENRHATWYLTPNSKLAPPPLMISTYISELSKLDGYDDGGQQTHFPTIHF